MENIIARLRIAARLLRCAMVHETIPMEDVEEIKGLIDDLIVMLERTQKIHGAHENHD